MCEFKYLTKKKQLLWFPPLLRTAILKNPARVCVICCTSFAEHNTAEAAWQRITQCLMDKKLFLWTVNPRLSDPGKLEGRKLYGIPGSLRIKWPSCSGLSGEMRARGKWSTSWLWTPILSADARYRAVYNDWFLPKWVGFFFVFVYIYYRDVCLRSFCFYYKQLLLRCLASC